MTETRFYFSEGAVLRRRKGSVPEIWTGEGWERHTYTDMIHNASNLSPERAAEYIGCG